MQKRRNEDYREQDQKRSRGPDSITPHLYDILRGEIASIQDYGVFVKIPRCEKQGLVHRTQMSNGRISHPADVAEVYDKVYCKVISVDSETGKFGLSMKLVNQGSGKDLDENNVQLGMDEQRRRQGPDNKFKKIILEAEYNTTCKKCGGRGHLAKECFRTGDKSYDLVPDVDEMVDKELTESLGERKSKKSKKEKKEKKHKHKKHSSKHKDKKEKKRRRSTSESRT